MYSDAAGIPNATEYPLLCELEPSPLFLRDDLSGDIVLDGVRIGLDGVDWSTAVVVSLPPPVQFIRDITASVVSLVALKGN